MNMNMTTVDSKSDVDSKSEVDGKSESHLILKINSLNI